MANGLYSGIVTVLTITGYSMAKDKPACGHRWTQVMVIIISCILISAFHMGRWKGVQDVQDVDRKKLGQE
jgi:hypothetical protein